MRPLLQQLEEMHIRIAETATHEETLVKALGDALTRLDEQLLQDVQSIATEHEARRTAILGELQGLASSIGMFQVPRPAAIEAETTMSRLPVIGARRPATSVTTPTSRSASMPRRARRSRMSNGAGSARR